MNTNNEKIGLLSRCSNSISRINVEIPLILYMISSFLQFPNTQAFIYKKSCLTLFNDTDFCQNSTIIHNNTEIQTMANHMSLISTLVQTFLSIPTTILLGAFGDRHSRKLSITLPLIGVILANANYVLQSYFMHWNIYLIFISDLIFGLFGGFASIISTIFSYAAEDSPTGRRSSRMAVLEGCIGVGGTIGYILSSVQNAYLDLSSIYLTATGLNIVACFFVLVFVNELHKNGNNSSSSENQRPKFYMAICVYVNVAITVAFKRRSNKARRIILIILLSFFINYLIFSGSQDIMYYYLHAQLNFSVGLYSYYLGLTFASSTLMVLFVYPWFKQMDFSDCALASFGVLSRMIGTVALCFPISNVYIFTISIFYMFNRFSAAGMRSIVSKQVSNEEQGQVFAVIALMQGICSLIASAIFNALYPITLKFFPGFCFALMATMALVPLSGLIYVYRLTNSSATFSTETANRNLVVDAEDSAIGSEDMLSSAQNSIETNSKIQSRPKFN